MSPWWGTSPHYYALPAPGAAVRNNDGPGAPPAKSAYSRASARPAEPAGSAVPAAPAAPDLPVARVAVDSPLPHLDRPFDYLVPPEMDTEAQPGTRVRVRFAGRLLDGWVLERAASSEHGGRLAPLHKAVSAEPVLVPEIAGLARAVADRWAGTLSDVVRLAVPPRHARVEAEPLGASGVIPGAIPSPPTPGGWSSYVGGERFLDALVAGDAPRAVWRALPGPGWPAEIAAAAQATLASGRGVVIVVPDARDLARVEDALKRAVGAECFVALTAELGPAQRYRRWLAVRRGVVRCAVGTRAAAWAPVRDLGLVVCWDDGDDLLKELRAPYPHLRDVLVLRAHRAGAGALIGGSATSVEAELLIARRWAQALAADRPTLRAAAPRVEVAGDDRQQERDAAASSARLPTLAWQAARESLAAGAPVLVQVPRTGYQPAVACSRCRTPARCVACAGPLGRVSGGPGPLACRWCGRPAADWACPVCEHRDLRAMVVGSRRTAEELGRSFPGVTVRTSDRDGIVGRVGAVPALVVCTPGAEPVADDGYGAVLLLDGAAMLARADLRAGEEALRRWLAAAALARPAPAGGRVVLMADASLAPVQALVRWDPSGFARREYAERAELGLPPAVRMAALDGAAADVAALLAAAAPLPASAQVLGPVPHDGGDRLIVRVMRSDGQALAGRLHVGLGVLSARKATGPVRVELDPLSPV
ncbi:MAG TPA: primosomal protein N' [Mycobacteriales bacterium]|nr:primosomal protein N' [Mycobacteriales bacterium]